MMNDNQFTLELTNAEIVAATSLLGMAELTLPYPLANDSLLDIETALQEGTASLLEKELVRSENPSQWQVHQFLSTIIYWLLMPDYAVQWDIWRRNGVLEQRRVHFWQGKPLWVHYHQNQYELTIMEEPDLWSVMLMEWLGWQKFEKKAPAQLAFRMPLTSMNTFMPALLKNAQDGLQMLRHAGLTVEESELSHKVLRSAESCGLVALTKWDGIVVIEAEQMAFLANPQALWGTSIVSVDKDVATLEPMSSSEFIQFWQMWAQKLMTTTNSNDPNNT